MRFMRTFKAHVLEHQFDFQSGVGDDSASSVDRGLMVGSILTTTSLLLALQIKKMNKITPLPLGTI